MLWNFMSSLFLQSVVLCYAFAIICLFITLSWIHFPVKTCLSYMEFYVYKRLFRFVLFFYFLFFTLAQIWMLLFGVNHTNWNIACNMDHVLVLHAFDYFLTCAALVFSWHENNSKKKTYTKCFMYQQPYCAHSLFLLHMYNIYNIRNQRKLKFKRIWKCAIYFTYIVFSQRYCVLLILYILHIALPHEYSFFRICCLLW